MVTVQTPGQALHESLRESALATFGPATPEFATWDEVPRWQRDRLETAGKAAVEAARLRQPAELAAALAETRELRSVVELLLGLYRPASGGWTSRTSIGRLARIAASAGIAAPAVTANHGDVPDEPDTARALDLARDELGALAAEWERNAVERGEAAAASGTIGYRKAAAAREAESRIWRECAGQLRAGLGGTPGTEVPGA